MRFRDVEIPHSARVSTTHGREGLFRLGSSDTVLATTDGGEIRLCAPAERRIHAAKILIHNVTGRGRSQSSSMRDGVASVM